MDPQDLAGMARKHGTRLLLQFGSSVTGRLHPDSDIDFGVLLERVPDTLEQEADLIAVRLKADPTNGLFVRNCIARSTEDVSCGGTVR